MHARPRQTDRRTNIVAIARQFVLTNALRAKNGMCKVVSIGYRTNSQIDERNFDESVVIDETDGVVSQQPTSTTEIIHKSEQLSRVSYSACFPNFHFRYCSDIGRAVFGRQHPFCHRLCVGDMDAVLFL